MEFQDFPRFLGNSGKYELHPPKLCAGLLPSATTAVRRGLGKRAIARSEVTLAMEAGVADHRAPLRSEGKPTICSLNAPARSGLKAL